MKQTFILFISLFFLTTLFGQSKSQIIFDTSNNKGQFNNRKFYGKTDFSFIDTLELWNQNLTQPLKEGKEIL